MLIPFALHGPSCRRPLPRSNWRSTNEADIDTALRTCPVCRQTCFFVTPSSVWPSTPEEKADIVDGYKSKLKATDCMHFNYGDGTCPFGTSCFYRHVNRNGEEETPSLRWAGTADSGVRVIQPVRLCDFLTTPQARRIMRQR